MEVPTANTQAHVAPEPPKQAPKEKAPASSRVPSIVVGLVAVAVAGLSIWYLLRGEPLLVQGEVDAIAQPGSASKRAFNVSSTLPAPRDDLQTKVAAIESSGTHRNSRDCQELAAHSRLGRRFAVTLLTSTKVVRNEADISSGSCAVDPHIEPLPLLGRGSIATINLKKRSGSWLATQISSPSSSGFGRSLAFAEPGSPIDFRSRSLMSSTVGDGRCMPATSEFSNSKSRAKASR
jgi:hypothetical protein